MEKVEYYRQIFLLSKNYVHPANNHAPFENIAVSMVFFLQRVAM